eukprot:1978206-Rhodomonas_salina.1
MRAPASTAAKPARACQSLSQWPRAPQCPCQPLHEPPSGFSPPSPARPHTHRQLELRWPALSAHVGPFLPSTLAPHLPQHSTRRVPASVRMTDTEEKDQQREPDRGGRRPARWGWGRRGQQQHWAQKGPLRRLARRGRPQH